MEAYAEVERLLSQMARMAQNHQAAAKLSDQISVLCRGYMTPKLETEWDKYGLTRMETRFMDVLTARHGQTVPHGEMLDAMYFDKTEEADKPILGVFACKIRKKLAGSPFTLETDHSRGYRLLKAA